MFWTSNEFIYGALIIAAVILICMKTVFRENGFLVYLIGVSGSIGLPVLFFFCVANTSYFAIVSCLVVIIFWFLIFASLSKEVGDDGDWAVGLLMFLGPLAALAYHLYPKMLRYLDSINPIGYATSLFEKIDGSIVFFLLISLFIIGDLLRCFFGLNNSSSSQSSKKSNDKCSCSNWDNIGWFNSISDWRGNKVRCRDCGRVGHLQYHYDADDFYLS